MKALRLTEVQKAFILKQGRKVRRWPRSATRRGLANDLLRLDEVV